MGIFMGENGEKVSTRGTDPIVETSLEPSRAPHHSQGLANFQGSGGLWDLVEVVKKNGNLGAA
jgi:hypothetical protein